MKRFLSTLLSFTLTLASLPAAGDDRNDPVQENRVDDVVADIVAMHIGGSEADYVEGTQVVAEFDAADEMQVARELRGMDNVTFALGNNDPVRAVLDENKNMMIEADSQADIPILSESRLRGLLSNKDKVKASIARHAQKRFVLLQHRAEAHKKKTAVLVSVFAGGVYGTYYFLLTSSYLVLAGTGIEGFFNYLGVSMLNKQWIGLSRYGVGNATSVVGALALSGVMGKPTGKRAKVYFRRSGQLLTAYLLNILSTSLMMETAGQMGNPAATLVMFQNALYGAHDTLDIKARQKYGEKIGELLSPLRIFGCMLLEAFAMNGSQTAEYTIVGAIGLFSTLFVFREWKWAKRRLINHKERAFARLKEKYSSLGPTRFWTGRRVKKDVCNKELTPPSEDEAE
jgi:hypothetical protein